MRRNQLTISGCIIIVFIFGLVFGTMACGLFGLVVTRSQAARLSAGLAQTAAFASPQVAWAGPGGDIAGVLVVNAGTGAAATQFALVQGPDGLTLDLDRLHFAADAATGGAARTPQAVVIEGRALTLRQGPTSMVFGVGRGPDGRPYRQFSALMIGSETQVLLNLTQPVHPSATAPVSLLAR
jgi:hypothetical protein